MRRLRTILLAVSLLCGTFLAIDFLALLASTQATSGQSSNGHGALEAPLVRFSQANTKDKVGRGLRSSRNSRYDKSASKPIDQLPPEATSSGLVSEWDAHLPALPTAQSDAIVLGEVLDAKAFLSNDKTGAYSEFTVKAGEVLKSNGSLKGGRLTVQRQGAKVELPSGRIFDVEVIGQRMPQVGHRYILFLTYNKETKDYFVLTGYQIAGEKVFPLDTIQKFAVYENVDANSFLSDLDAATRHPPAPPIKKEGQQAQMPVAPYSAKLPADRAEQELRVARNSRYDKRVPMTFTELPIDTTAYSTNSHWWLGIPALPTAESDAVVIGKIGGVNAYISNDKTGAYSEFTIRVKRVFKNDTRLSTGSLVAEREGANVQLPDGRIVRYGIAGQGMPQVGRRYVLFLQYNEAAKVYDIITGYELRDHYVFPLDNAVERFTAYTGTDEQSFLSAVQSAVSHPPQVPQDKREVRQ